MGVPSAPAIPRFRFTTAAALHVSTRFFGGCLLPCMEVIICAAPFNKICVWKTKPRDTRPPEIFVLKANMAVGSFTTQPREHSSVKGTLLLWTYIRIRLLLLYTTLRHKTAYEKSRVNCIECYHTLSVITYIYLNGSDLLFCTIDKGHTPVTAYAVGRTIYSSCACWGRNSERPLPVYTKHATTD